MNPSYRNDFDIIFTGESSIRQMGETYAGSSFGELALLHGTKRAASIRCKGTNQHLILAG